MAEYCLLAVGWKSAAPAEVIEDPNVALLLTT